MIRQEPVKLVSGFEGKEVLWVISVATCEKCWRKVVAEKLPDGWKTIQNHDFCVDCTWAVEDEIHRQIQSFRPKTGFGI